MSVMFGMSSEDGLKNKLDFIESHKSLSAGVGSSGGTPGASRLLLPPCVLLQSGYPDIYKDFSAAYDPLYKCEAMTLKQKFSEFRSSLARRKAGAMPSGG